MNHIRITDIPWEKWTSPGGSFAGAGQQVSIALGAKQNAFLNAGGHPFDLEIGRLPPGKAGCPFHQHAAQWELFIIMAGCGEVRFGGERRAVKPGDVVMHPPGEPHQLTNTGSEELVYHLIADNPPIDYYYYPNSEKWGICGNGIFRRQDAGYWEGEETGAPGPTRSPHPFTEQAVEPLARFVNLGELPWETRQSPGGKYGSSFQDVSIALGAPPNLGAENGGHPFDVQIRRVPPGRAICPFHSHSTQWELFLINAGTARIRSGEKTHLASPGDAILHPPGTPHQTLNPGSDDLEVTIIANNPAEDHCYYPDSDKHACRSFGKFYRVQIADYFDGEE